MNTLNVKRIEDAQEWLELAAEDYNASQSIGWLIDQLGLLCKSMAFINGQMAVAKKVLNEKKAKAYETMVVSSIANEQYFSPMLARDYINSKVADYQYNYDMAERCSRTILHTIDSVRTCISALKEEAKISSYAGTV